MRLVAAFVVLILVIGLAVGGWAVYTGRGDFMPASVKAAATKAVGAAGGAVSSEKSSGEGQEGKEDSGTNSGKESSQAVDPHKPEGGAQRITLPRALEDVKWSMNRAEITQLYPIAEKRTEHGQRVLVHYRDASEKYVVKFRFRDENLVEVEIRISTAQGETVEELYKTLKSHYASKLERFAVSETRWSDGKTTARIFSMGDKVYVRFERERPKPKPKPKKSR